MRLGRGTGQGDERRKQWTKMRNLIERLKELSDESWEEIEMNDG
jgi:hypothetical protein